MARYRGTVAGATSLVLVLGSRQPPPRPSPPAAPARDHGLHGRRAHAVPARARSTRTPATAATPACTPTCTWSTTPPQPVPPGNHVTLTAGPPVPEQLQPDFERRSVNKTGGPYMAVTSVRVNGAPPRSRSSSPPTRATRTAERPEPAGAPASEVNPVGGPHQIRSRRPDPRADLHQPATKESGTHPVPGQQARHHPGSRQRREHVPVTVSYTGRPACTTTGTAPRGWFRSNQPAGDGGFVTTEPVGHRGLDAAQRLPSASHLRLLRHRQRGQDRAGQRILAGSRRHPAGARFPHGSVTWHCILPPVASYS